MKLLQTKDYLFFIDEKAEIKKGDYRIMIDKTSILYGEIEKHIGNHDCNEQWCKIIAYRKLNDEAKELDLPEPHAFEEVYIEKEFNSQYKNFVFDDVWEETLIKNAFKKGYKSAKPKQFSLEDMYSFARFCSDNHSLDDSNGQYDWQPIFREYKPKTNKEMFNDWNQSLSTQKFPSEFIPEYQKDWKETTKMLMESMGDNPEDFKYE